MLLIGFVVGHSNFPPSLLQRFEAFGGSYYLTYLIPQSCLLADFLLKMKKSLEVKSFETFHLCCELLQHVFQDKKISSSMHFAKLFVSDCFVALLPVNKHALPE